MGVKSIKTPIKSNIIFFIIIIAPYLSLVNVDYNMLWLISQYTKIKYYAIITMVIRGR